MIPSGKWIDGLCADCAVEDAARRSLDARLRPVIHWMPLAAYLAEQDVEHVHRLRVSTRRAIAALRLYRDWLPRKSARWLKRRLKKIRRAAGDARDLDVLAERLSGDYGERAEPVGALIAECRAAVQPAIVDAAERCRHGDQFIRKTGKLLSSIEPPSPNNGQSICFRDWAAVQLEKAAASFFAALPNKATDTTELHQCRIRAKALRYTIELVAPAFDAQLREVHYPVVEEMQERLGVVQDHVTAGERLSEWADGEPDSDLQTLLRDLAVEEHNRLDIAVGEFRDWWTEERVESLRRGMCRFDSERGNEGGVKPVPQPAGQM